MSVITTCLLKWVEMVQIKRDMLLASFALLLQVKEQLGVQAVISGIQECGIITSLLKWVRMVWILYVTNNLYLCAAAAGEGAAGRAGSDCRHPGV